MHKAVERRAYEPDGEIVKRADQKSALVRNSRMLLDPALASMASRSQSEALSSFLMDGVQGSESSIGSSGGGGGSNALTADGKSMLLSQIEAETASNRWQPMRGKRNQWEILEHY